MLFHIIFNTLFIKPLCRSKLDDKLSSARKVSKNRKWLIFSLHIAKVYQQKFLQLLGYTFCISIIFTQENCFKIPLGHCRHTYQSIVKYTTVFVQNQPIILTFFLEAPGIPGKPGCSSSRSAFDWPQPLREGVKNLVTKSVKSARGGAPQAEVNISPRNQYFFTRPKSGPARDSRSPWLLASNISAQSPKKAVFLHIVVIFLHGPPKKSFFLCTIEKEHH